MDVVVFCLGLKNGVWHCCVRWTGQPKRWKWRNVDRRVWCTAGGSCRWFAVVSYAAVINTTVDISESWQMGVKVTVLCSVQWKWPSDPGKYCAHGWSPTLLCSADSPQVWQSCQNSEYNLYQKCYIYLWNAFGFIVVLYCRCYICCVISVWSIEY